MDLPVFQHMQPACRIIVAEPPIGKVVSVEILEPDREVFAPAIGGIMIDFKTADRAVGIV